MNKKFLLQQLQSVSEDLPLYMTCVHRVLLILLNIIFSSPVWRICSRRLIISSSSQGFSAFRHSALFPFCQVGMPAPFVSIVLKDSVSKLFGHNRYPANHFFSGNHGFPADNGYILRHPSLFLPPEILYSFGARFCHHPSGVLIFFQFLDSALPAALNRGWLALYRNSQDWGLFHRHWYPTVAPLCRAGQSCADDPAPQ